MSRENALRTALTDDEPVVGARCETKLPLFVEVYGGLGFDFVWIDFEHGGASPEDARVLEALTRASDAADIELLVRLPRGDPTLIRKVLDAGVRTILIPRVETAAEVRTAVRAARFWYEGDPGDRGIGAGRSSLWGHLDTEYVTREDESVLVGTMIENRTAVANIHDILSVPDLGFAFVGPSDLSVSLGHPLDLDHPTVSATIDEIEGACREHGVPIGGILPDPNETATYIENGYRILRVGGEIVTTRAVMGDHLMSVRSAIDDSAV